MFNFTCFWTLCKWHNRVHVLLQFSLCSTFMFESFMMSSWIECVHLKFCLMFHCINISQFIRSVANRHLDCLQFYPITNNAAMKILVLASLPCAVCLYQTCQWFVSSCSVCHLLVLAHRDRAVARTCVDWEGEENWNEWKHSHIPIAQKCWDN